jgi:hypothetical protein
VVVVHIYDKGYYLMMKSYSSVAVKFTTKVEFEFHYRVSVGLYKRHRKAKSDDRHRSAECSAFDVV